MKKNTWKTVAIVISAIAIFITAIFFYEALKKKALAKKIAPNIMLVKHNFIYAAQIEFKDGSVTEINLVKLADNKYDLYIPDSSLPNLVIANAVMMNDSGDCITSAYAAAPWNNEIERQNIYDHLAKQIQGLDVKSIIISGKSLCLTVTPASTQTWIGRDSAMEYVHVGGDRSIATISRKYKTDLLPVHSIESETTSAKEVLDKKQLLLFALPADLNNVSGAGYQKVEISAVVLSDYSVLVSYPVIDFLNEGAPLFDQDGKLVAIITQRYTEDHERAGENVASIINVNGKQSYEPIRLRVILSVVNTENKKGENNDQAETGVIIPFREEEGWIKIAEAVYSIMDSTDQKWDFSLDHTNPTRLRINYKPGDTANPNLQINVYRMAWEATTLEYLPFSVEKTNITQEGLSVVDLHLLLYGNYKLEVKNAEGDRYSIIVEQREQVTTPE